VEVHVQRVVQLELAEQLGRDTAQSFRREPAVGIAVGLIFLERWRLAAPPFESIDRLLHRLLRAEQQHLVVPRRRDTVEVVVGREDSAALAVRRLQRAVGREP
jgi:hypothetical protein